MIKVVITRNRDRVDEPTQFLDNEGYWNSVANKKEFEAIAKKVKIEFNKERLEDLVGSVKYEGNVKVNIEYDVEDYLNIKKEEK